jgi:hypothetical protein
LLADEPTPSEVNRFVTRSGGERTTRSAVGGALSPANNARWLRLPRTARNSTTLAAVFTCRGGDTPDMFSVDFADPHVISNGTRRHRPPGAVHDE